ncbi:hypothetical protein QEN19_001608 [Hanseniaspora menglaensis]
MIELIDTAFICFIWKQANNHFFMIFSLILIVLIVNTYKQQNYSSNKDSNRKQNCISFDFHGQLVTISLKQEFKKNEYDENEDLVNKKKESKEQQCLPSYNDIESDDTDVAADAAIHIKSFFDDGLEQNENNFEHTELIKNTYRTKSNLLENLHLVKEEDSEILLNLNNKEAAADDNTTIGNIYLDDHNHCRLRDFKNNDPYILEQIPSSGYATSSRSVSVETREAQQPVKDLIMKFENISSASSLTSADDSFLNNNILNKGIVRMNENLESKANSTILSDSNGFQTPRKNDSSPVKMFKNELTNSVSSKGSSNIFFSPYIQSSLHKSLTLKAGSNILVFKDDNDTNVTSLANRLASGSTRLFPRAVETQEIVATGTIITPDSISSKVR